MRVNEVNVVIVDDQTSARTMLRHILEDIGPELAVHDFGDPAAALAWCENNRPDLLLLDYRMPGHMNVLLAEADIPYTDLVEMEDINPEMPQVDVALVIGANDVVNPAAKYLKSSPIYGMPIIDASKAKTVFAIKRSNRPGFAGIDNELYSAENTWMLFGDAKQVVGELGKHLSGVHAHT